MLTGSRAATSVILLVAAVVVFALLGPKWPKDQSLRFVLGDAAARVEEISVRYAPLNDAEDWTREASFRYAAGQAPRIVSHDVRLADGDYVVEIELATKKSRVLLTRRVTLVSGTTKLDLTEGVPE
jgi:hypothetical protein